MVTKFLCGHQFHNVEALHSNEAWWASQVCCSKAEVVTEAVPQEFKPTALERFHTLTDDDGQRLVVKNSLHELKGPPEHLLGKEVHRTITAFIEVRQPYWTYQPANWLTYHSFLVLEVDNGAFHLLCERKTDLLELVIGDVGMPLRFIKALRAYGPGRDVRKCIEQPRRRLTNTVTVYDFFDWVNGPLEEGWGQYDLFHNNCQHFTKEIQSFLLEPTQPMDRVCFLELAPVHLQMSHEYVKAEVERSWLSLKFAREDFRRDKSMVLSAVRQDGRALRYAHSSLRNDRDTVLIAVRNDGTALPYVDGMLRQDREVVQAAVKQNGDMLCYAALEHRLDRAVALSAVRQDAYALRYVPKELQCDPEVLLAALCRNPLSALWAAC